MLPVVPFLSAVLSNHRECVFAGDAPSCSTSGHSGVQALSRVSLTSASRLDSALFTFPLLDMVECARTIELAEAHARGNWTDARHAQFQTTDIAVRSDPGLERFLDPIISRLQDLSSQLYGRDLIFHDVFVVKYSMEGQRSLDAHQDSSLISFQVLLSSTFDFDGGGTYFLDEDVDCLARLKLGEAILFGGSLMHSGQPITRGNRYVLVGFSSGQQPGGDRVDGGTMVDDPSESFPVSFGLHYQVSEAPASAPSLHADERALRLQVSWEVDARCNNSAARMFELHRMTKDRHQQQAQEDPVELMWLVCKCVSEANSTASYQMVPGNQGGKAGARLPLFSHKRTAGLSLDVEQEHHSSTSTVLFAFPPGHSYVAYKLR